MQQSNRTKGQFGVKMHPPSLRLHFRALGVRCQRYGPHERYPGRRHLANTMNTGYFKRIYPFLVVSALVIMVDQATKYMVLSALSLHEIRPVIPGLFNLIYVTNTGAAFGFLAGSEKWRHLFFMSIGIAALGGLVYLLVVSRTRDPLFFWGLSLILGGASGNLIDRVLRKHVIDFLDFYIGSYHWPAFNIADSAITVGGIMLAVHLLRHTSSAGVQDG